MIIVVLFRMLIHRAGGSYRTSKSILLKFYKGKSIDRSALPCPLKVTQIMNKLRIV